MDTTPRYRIHAVAERTGVPTATLRAWERRYGVPEPARSAARYRLYSEQDVAVVRRMAGLCAAGMRPAEAAIEARAEPTAAPRSHELAPVAIIERIVEAFRGLDSEAMRTALQLAISAARPADAYEQLIAPALQRVGQLWKDGELSIAHEHAGSHVISEVLSTLLHLATPPPPAPVVVLACFDEEQHELGLLGFGLHVASWGFRPLLLGGRVPPKALHDAVVLGRPALVGISVVVPPQVDARAAITGYARACGDVPWIVGGPGAGALAEIVERRGGHIAPPELDRVRALIDRLIGRKHRREKKVVAK